MRRIIFKNRCKLRIRHVPKIGDGDMGEFLELQNKTFNRFFDIKFSMRENLRPSVWFRTLIHELLHFAFRVFGYVYGKWILPRSEHEFISRVEDTVLLELKRLRFYKRKGKEVTLGK